MSDRVFRPGDRVWAACSVIKYNEPCVAVLHGTLLPGNRLQHVDRDYGVLALGATDVEAARSYETQLLSKAMVVGNQWLQSRQDIRETEQKCLLTANSDERLRLLRNLHELTLSEPATHDRFHYALRELETFRGDYADVLNQEKNT